jgi:hypothetical protein
LIIIIIIIIISSFIIFPLIIIIIIITTTLNFNAQVFSARTTRSTACMMKEGSIET